jgi:hypothetical protein
MRALVNDVPAWALALLFVGTPVVLGVVGFLAIHRLDFRSPSTGMDTMVSAFSTRATTLFGVLLVFVIVAEFSHFKETQANADQEAGALAQIVRDSGAFPPGPQQAIRAGVAAYGNAVVHDEWPRLHDG